MNQWQKYIQHNKTCRDCQLVTALNAYCYLTGEQWCQQNSNEYERLLDLTKCRHGAAICIENAHKELGIEIIWSGISLYDVKLYSTDGSLILPMEWNTWSYEYGFHSNLIVDQNKDKVRVTNFSKVNPAGWTLERDMPKYENFSVVREYNLFRLFGIQGDPWNKEIKKMWLNEKQQWFIMMRNLYIDRIKQQTK